MIMEVQRNSSVIQIAEESQASECMLGERADAVARQHTKQTNILITNETIDWKLDFKDEMDML